MMQLDKSLSSAARERVQQELRPGEELHWAGMPGKIKLHHRIPVYVFATAWLVLMLRMAWALAQVWGAWVWLLLTPLSALIFVLDALRMRKKGCLVYMVTNHRVAWINLHRQEVCSMALRSHMVSGTVMRVEGRGDIVFSADSAEHSDALFYDISQVRRVVALINDLSAGR
ncbi:MAG: hypothetical protein IKV92_01535 [Akkermansia sp.]|nr:hypothetical protein [Akkermansia sp.]